MLMTSQRLDKIHSTLRDLDTFLKECVLAGYEVSKGPGGLGEEFYILTVENDEWFVSIYFDSCEMHYKVTRWAFCGVLGEVMKTTKSVDDIPGLVSSALREETWT